MSKKKDPIVSVMEFFEGASLDAAQSALALAHAIVKKRQPVAEKKKKGTTRKPVTVRTAPINQATPIVPPAPTPVAKPEAAPRAETAAPASTRRSRTRVVVPAAPPAPGNPGLALPGLGPSTIGD
jgi:hypothetical protein